MVMAHFLNNSTSLDGLYSELPQGGSGGTKIKAHFVRWQDEEEIGRYMN